MRGLKDAVVAPFAAAEIIWGPGGALEGFAPVEPWHFTLRDGFNSTSVSMESAKQYADEKARHKIIFHVVSSRNGAFIGQHSWINTDKEVLFDRKCKFRALKPGEKGYIKDDVINDGFQHIAIMEV